MEKPLPSAQVYSQNIVGYQQKALTQNGYTFTGATFVPVGMDGSAMTLSEIKANANFVPFEDSIQIFDSAGSLVALVTYVSQAKLVEWEMEETNEPGWYDLVDEELAAGPLDIPLPFGYGVTAFTGYAGAALVYAGEVVQDDVRISLIQGGYTFAVNVAPVDLLLGDIVANANFVPFEDSIQIFDSTGAPVALATYVSQAKLVEWEMEETNEPGWYDLVDEELTGATYNDIPMLAGDGMTVFTGYSGVELIIPNPLP